MTLRTDTQHLLAPLPEREWDRRKAAHLLDRAGFGGPPEDVDRLTDMGLQEAVRHLVYPERQAFDPPPPEWVRYLTPETDSETARPDRARNAERLEFLRAWWIERMVRTPRPLEEKMTLFWHSHFATPFDLVRDPYLMYLQNETFRRHALDFFEVILVAAARDPAVVRALDLESNRKGRPNDNFARELMELYTLGEGNYTEKDVTEAARAFTGWTIRGHAFHFDSTGHDDGEKAFLGRRGPYGGVDIIRIIMKEKAARTFVPGKLFEFFAYRHPADALVEELGEVYSRYYFNVREWLRTLFTSRVFYSDAALGARIKSPVEYVVGTLRRADVGDMPALRAALILREMGQNLFHPPDVDGWKEGDVWINTTTMIARYQFAHYLSTGEWPEVFRAARPADVVSDAWTPAVDTPLIDPVRWCSRRHYRNAEACARDMAHRLFGREMTGPMLASAAHYLQTASNNAPVVFDLNRRTSRERLADAVYVMLCSPEYQMC